MHDEQPRPEDDDVEAHAFKWTAQDDGKGGKRMRQGWDPDSPPPGLPERPRAPGPKGQEPKGR